jgi:hypothetical protein
MPENLKSACIYPARQADNHDVVLRVVAKEGDKPTSELDVLRFLSTEKAQAHPQNIALPILEEFVCDGWTFIRCLNLRTRGEPLGSSAWPRS